MEDKITVEELGMQLSSILWTDTDNFSDGECIDAIVSLLSKYRLLTPNPNNNATI